MNPTSSRLGIALFTATLLVGCMQSPVPGTVAAERQDEIATPGGFQTQSIFDRRYEERQAAARRAAAEMARHDEMKQQQRVATEISRLMSQLARLGPVGRLTSKHSPNQQVVYLRDLQSLATTMPNDVNYFLVSINNLPSERFNAPSYSVIDNVQVFKGKLDEERSLKQVMVLLNMQRDVDVRKYYPLDVRINDFKNMVKLSFLNGWNPDIRTWSGDMKDYVKRQIGVDVTNISGPKVPTAKELDISKSTTTGTNLPQKTPPTTSTRSSGSLPGSGNPLPRGPIFGSGCINPNCMPNVAI